MTQINESEGDQNDPEFDNVFDKHVQEFGRYQKCLYWMTYYLFIPLGMQFGLMVFVTGTPPFRCSDVNTTCDFNKCCDGCTKYEFDGVFSSIVSEVCMCIYFFVVYDLIIKLKNLYRYIVKFDEFK